jgi:DNA-binding transcriptional MerR regulator
MDIDDLYTVKEVAEILGLSTVRVYQLKDELGVTPIYKAGRYFYTPTQLNQLMQNRRPVGRPRKVSA